VQLKALWRTSAGFGAKNPLVGKLAERRSKSESEVNSESKPSIERRQNMADTNAAIAVYDNHSEAEDAVKEIQKSGFDMKKLSVGKILLLP
jgi:hypothetical protein